MKNILAITIIATGILLAGCVDNGKGPAAAAADGNGNAAVFNPKLVQYEGPAGGGNEDQTSPDMPGYSLPNGSTNSAFPVFTDATSNAAP